MKLEHVIFSNLVSNEDYLRKVFPFIQRDYFSDTSDKVIFELIHDYINKYNRAPSKEALKVDLQLKDSISGDVYSNVEKTIDELAPDAMTNMNWLVDNTEKFCQDKALYNAVLESIKIMDDNQTQIPRSAIPKILQDALGISFDSQIGHDFIEDADERFEFYHRHDSRLPFDIELLNKITGGGLPPKSLSVLLAGTGVGKSLAMCHMAAANLMLGKNVLYITMEMSEEKIAERIDANLMNTPIQEMLLMDKETFDRKIARIKSKTVGKLVVKEYPTASAGSANFRHLLNELKMKRNFVPDVIYIDYLNICMSSRIKAGANVNSYTMIKAIAEELRGLAVEFNVPIITATQINRTGFASSDPELTDTSESFGLPATADFMIAMSQSEQLAELGQIMFKQLKNRYNDINFYKRFVVGVDKSKMRLFDLDQDEANMEDKPLMDKTEFGQQDFDRKKPKSKFANKFGDFK